jgi:hypothetical protein
LAYRLILFALLLLGGVAGPPARAADSSDWFNYQVDFKTDYTVLGTPPGFRGGTSAWTYTTISPWALDGKGMTVSVDHKRSQVLDWVLNPAKYGFTADAVARLRGHEQVHYDLAALWLREYLNKAKGQPRQKQIDLWNDMLTHSIQALDNAYEGSTGTDSNSPVQDEWTKQIGALKSRSDGSFSELEQWARQKGYFKNAASKRLPARPR